MNSEAVEIPRPVLTELVECLEEAQRWHMDDDEQFEHRITLALDDYKTATWEPTR